MNYRAATASIASLQGLRWNSFQVAATSAKFIPLVMPSFVVTSVSSVIGAQGMGASLFTFYVDGAGASPSVIPAWCVPGAGVQINATIAATGTAGAAQFTINGIVKDVDTTAGLSFSISPSNQNGEGFTKAYNNQALAAVGGSVVNTVTLVAQCQKVMFSVASGGNNVTIAPVADFNGANPLYSVLVTAGGSEYEVTAPTGSKFDLADWYCQGVGGTGTLQVRFL